MMENLQRCHQEQRALGGLLKSLESPNPVLTQTRTLALDLKKLQMAKQHLQMLSKIYDLT